jgi:hypothetical protein
MRSLHRYPNHLAPQTRGKDLGPDDLGGPPLAGFGGGDQDFEPALVEAPAVVEGPPTLERWDLVESRWNLGSVVVVLAGAALAVVGVVAAGRTGTTDSWYRPVETVAGVRHTPLLAAVETAVGVLLVIAGLAGARGVAALVCIIGAMAAGVAAIEPALVADQLALQRGWAITLAVAGAGLAVLSMVPWPHFVERHYTRAAETAPTAAPAALTPPARAPDRIPQPAGMP